MAENIRQHLLQPSLTRGASGRPMYSGAASFMVAVLGGTIGLTLFSLINSYHVRRLKRDLRWYALAIAITAALCVAFLAKMQAAGGDEAEKDTFGFMWVASRICAPFVWAAYYFLHRRAHRITGLSGGEYGRALAPGLVCIAASHWLLVALLDFFRTVVGVDW